MTGIPNELPTINPVIPSPGDGTNCVCKDRGLEKGDTLYIYLPIGMAELDLIIYII